MQQTLNTATQIDERAELAHRYHAARHDRAGGNRLPDLVGCRALLLLEKGTPGDDDVLAPFRVLDDAELVDPPLVHRRIAPEQIDL